jgi:hypothetical protein
VNFAPPADSDVRATARLSARGVAVLIACAASRLRYAQATDCDLGGSGGLLSFNELLRLAPARPTVARASLSRTLRRLWRRGLIELITEHGHTLSAKYANAAVALQTAEKDPEGTYALAEWHGGFFPYETPTEYLEHLRYSVRQRILGQRMHYVQITSAGRERLSSRRRDVNRKGAGRPGLEIRHNHQVNTIAAGRTVR